MELANDLAPHLVSPTQERQPEPGGGGTSFHFPPKNIQYEILSDILMSGVRVVQKTLYNQYFEFN